MDLEKLQALSGTIKILIKETNRLHALSAKAGNADLSPKQAQKASVDANWRGMEVRKVTMKAHALAVDCGLADARDREYYEEMTFNPDAWHKFKHQPELPECYAQEVAS